MADNVVLKSMVGGDTMGADDISGVKYQRIKLISGENGTNDGDIADSNPLAIKDVKTTIGNNIKVVTTAGTDEAIAGSTVCKSVTIQAQTDNTGLIAVGTSGVDATVATGTGVLLYPGDSITIEIDNLSKVYIDSTVSGEGVRFTYLV